jgi:sec-independent protein translocase protein TatB
MFDFSWSEIMVIGIVALIAIGPKDMPVAIRAITRVLKKMRRMAGEFQHHVDDMLKEADLQDVQSTFRDLRSMNVKSALTNFVDSDGSLSRAMADPFDEHPVPPVHTSAASARAAAMGPIVAAPPPPDFVPPPVFVPPHDAMPSSAAPPAPARPAPAFVPPAAAAATPPPLRAEDL